MPIDTTMTTPVDTTSVKNAQTLTQPAHDLSQRRRVVIDADVAVVQCFALQIRIKQKSQ